MEKVDFFTIMVSLWWLIWIADGRKFGISMFILLGYLLLLSVNLVEIYL